MPKQLSSDEFLQIVDNWPNKINLVGNAQSLLEYSYGDAIDRDFVIRFNTPNFRKHSKSLGKRVNWLCAGNANFMKMRVPEYYISEKFTIARYGEFDKVNNRNERMLDRVLFLPGDLMRLFKLDYPRHPMASDKTPKQNPSSGFLYVLMLNKFKPHANVTLYGFDFKKTRSHYYPTQYDKFDIPENCYHNYQYEEETTQLICKNNNWKIV